MKKFLFVLFITVNSVFINKAQTSETISQLTPVPSNIGKFSKRLPVNKNRIINNDNLKFDVSIEPVYLPNKNHVVAITIKTIYKEFVFYNLAGKLTATLNIYGRVTSEDKNNDGFFVERLLENAEVDDLINGQNKEIVLNKMFELPKGNYQIGVIITDIVSGIRGIKLVKFSIPQSINTQNKDD